ncbi:hypothetical protein GCM10029992_48440 [Glycomyces albus]
MRAVRGDRIGMIFQDPLSSLNPYYTVGTQIAEAYRSHRKGVTRRQARAVAIEAMERVHIRDAARRVDHYPHQFSGGMRQRVMIAMTLSMEPELIIADEPTTALDVTVQAQILDLLAEIRAETGAGLVLITHDLAVVSEVTDHIVVMRDGDLIESGPVERIFTDPQEEYTRMLLDAVPASTTRSDCCAPPRARWTPRRAMNGTPEPLLRARNLVKEFATPGSGPLSRARRFRAVDDVSLDVRAGETLALVGESGSGKSTTARLIARLIDTTSGSIEFAGREVHALTGRALHAYRGEVQVVFQDPYSSLNPRHSVERIVTAPLVYQRRPIPGGARAFTKELMERVGLDPDHSARFPSQFSGARPSASASPARSPSHRR